MTAHPRSRGLLLWLFATLAILAAVATVPHADPTSEEAVRRAVRLTARTSLGLFALTFAARALAGLWPSAATEFLRRHRRHLGLAFATSHLIHAALFIRLGTLSPELGREVFAPQMLIAGGSGYLFIALLAATSNDAAQRWLGAERWRRLHTVGAYWLWVVFVLSVAKRLSGGPIYAVMLAVLVGALALRVLERSRAARATATPRSGR